MATTLERPGPGEWKPAERPFRVTWTRRTGCTLNWLQDSAVYPTYEEAKAQFDAPSKVRGLMDVQLHEAMNPGTWSKNGSWKLLNKRKPYKKSA